MNFRDPRDISGIVYKFPVDQPENPAVKTATPQHGGGRGPRPGRLSASDCSIVKVSTVSRLPIQSSHPFSRSVSFPYCKPVRTKLNYLDGNQCRDMGILSPII